MDLIASLTSQLGIDSDKAQGLAGVVLGKLEEQVGQKLGGGDAAALRDQVPELSDWKAKGAALDASSSGAAGGLLGALGGGDLLGAAGSLLGGAGGSLGGAGGGLDVAALVQLAARAGLSGGAAEKLLPIVVSFLKSRLDPALLSRVLSVVPGLEKLAGGASGLGGGGLGRLLGGIL
jgi:hypothetical protein